MSTGNASDVNDAATAVVLLETSAAKARGAQPLARLMGGGQSVAAVFKRLQVAPAHSRDLRSGQCGRPGKGGCATWVVWHVGADTSEPGLCH